MFNFYISIKVVLKGGLGSSPRKFCTVIGTNLGYSRHF